MARERQVPIQPCLSQQSELPGKAPLTSAHVSSNNSQVCPNLLFNLSELVNNFKAGNVANHLHEWQKYTSDPEILQIVKGDTITFEGSIPENSFARNCNVSPATKRSMDEEIQNMIEKNIIVRSSHRPGEYLSPIFPVLKSDDRLRIILNLKRLNQSVEYLHFKMDNIRVVLANVTQNCYMATLDLKSAYHSVKIDIRYQKYLKFQWNDHYYQ